MQLKCIVQSAMYSDRSVCQVVNGSILNNSLTLYLQSCHSSLVFLAEHYKKFYIKRGAVWKQTTLQLVWNVPGTVQNLKKKSF